ncbi:MAG: D-TA family PLP-dependent enzyme [Fusobacteriaceae bacterium]|jgi:D-serine deaminase-like pyridoxal phosphate-dependent protein|nr:D-TA family PLP-dependent enzyme [Fusobacteriaceae bacterium]
MTKNIYELRNTENIITPALVYYKDLILENTKKAIAIAKSPDNLWPHVKSHKIREMIEMQLALGITRFKCATIAEGEMLGEARAPKVILAYPLVGPNVDRFLTLIRSYPETEYFAIGDDLNQLRLLGEKAAAVGLTVNALVDVNVGMNRTGTLPETCVDFYVVASKLKGLKLRGFHFYDGHLGITDVGERQKEVDAVHEKLRIIRDELKEKGYPVEIFVMGGSPEFPCHAKHENVWYSPGTVFLFDYAYESKFPDLPFVPAGIVLTRVVSHPKPGYFTLDLGHKGIGADPPGVRGKIVGIDHAAHVSQSEEHWVFQVEEGFEDEIPPVGSLQYVIPTHICPTSALYPSVLVAENGEITDEWVVAARNRKITV